MADRQTVGICSLNVQATNSIEMETSRRRAGAFANYSSVSEYKISKRSRFGSDGCQRTGSGFASGAERPAILDKEPDYAILGNLTLRHSKNKVHQSVLVEGGLKIVHKQECDR